MFLQAFFRVVSKPSRKRVNQEATVPVFNFFFAGQYSGLFVTTWKQAFLNVNRPSLMKRPYSKLRVVTKYLLVVLVFEKLLQQLKSVETHTPKRGSTVPAPPTVHPLPTAWDMCHHSLCAPSSRPSLHIPYWQQSEKNSLG